MKEQTRRMKHRRLLKFTVFLFTFAIVSTVMTSLPLEVLAAGEFTIEDGVLTAYSGTAEEVVVPDGVTTIGKNAFFDNTTIKKVTLPDSVQVIDDFAFYECHSLVSIHLPEGLLRIE